MRKILIILMCCFLLCGCENSTKQMPDPAAKTTSVVGEFGVQLEKKPLRMLNIDGTLYYDTNLLSDTKVKCGVMDCALRQTVELGQVPTEPGTANFNCQGVRHTVSLKMEPLFLLAYLLRCDIVNRGYLSIL